MTRFPFPHERLDAFHHARHARKLAWRYTRTLPRGFGDEASQINRAAASVVRNLAEGANRYKLREKIQKFEIAQGEAGEVAAAIASLLDIEMGDPALAAGVLAAIGRVGAMLTGLIRHCRR